MTDEPGRGRPLGRGLSALFGEERADEIESDDQRQSKSVPVEFLRPNRFQPRRDFDEVHIASLSDSIRERGVLQPILVRRDPDKVDAYEIIAGERRWRAAQRAQLHEVPIVITDVSDEGALEIAIVENIQRQDLNSLEEAEGYRSLIEDFGHTQEDLARVVGKSRSHVANTLRLLNLPGDVKRMLIEGWLSAGHARALLNADQPGQLARKVVEQGLNVRQTEKLAQRVKTAPAPRQTMEKDVDTLALERDLSNLLGLKVSVRFRDEGGELTIHYHTPDQLDIVLQRLTHGSPPTDPPT